MKDNHITLMLLEGLGGTITLTDHVKKVYNKYHEKPNIIIRRYSDLFKNNPYINNIISVGDIQYVTAIEKYKRIYEYFGVIKTGLGKWFGIDQSFEEHQKLFDNMPVGTNSLEKYGLNLIQMANLTLDLSNTNIENNVYYLKEVENLPPKYLVFSNGVDTWHKGLHQTKCWINTYWEELITMFDIPFIQVGTNYDTYIKGALDLRDKTDIPELLYILKRADCIVTTEGGLMHLGAAVNPLKILVLRGPTRGNIFNYPNQINIDSPVCNYCYWDTHLWYQTCPKGINNICMKTITPQRVAINMERVLA